MIAERWRAVEADLQRYYGVNAAEVDDARRLLVLIEGLPEECATRDGRGWGVDQELAAMTVEALGEVVRAVIASTGDQKALRRIKSLKIPRPRDEGKKQSAADRMRAFARSIRR